MTPLTHIYRRSPLRGSSRQKRLKKVIHGGHASPIIGSRLHDQDRKSSKHEERVACEAVSTKEKCVLQLQSVDTSNPMRMRASDVKQTPLKNLILSTAIDCSTKVYQFYVLQAMPSPTFNYRGTSLIRNSPRLGPYRSVMPRVLQCSQGRGSFL